MAKRKKFKLPNWFTQAAGKVKAAVRFVWRQTIVYNILMILIAILLFSTLLSQAFRPYFNCNFLISQSLSMPSFMCDGVDLTLVEVPGLARVMNGPLEGIRQAVLWIVLVVFIALSGYLTFILSNLKKIVKLLTLDKREWQNLLSTLRIFITILVLLTGLLFYWTIVR